jgi:hypothetical protein
MNSGSNNLCRSDDHRLRALKQVRVYFLLHHFHFPHVLFWLSAELIFTTSAVLPCLALMTSLEASLV